MWNKIKSFLPVYLYFLSRLPKALFLMPTRFYGRSAIRVFATDMGYKNPAEKIPTLVRSVQLEKLVSPQAVSLLYPHAFHGDVSTYELLALSSLIKALKPETILEIGTLHGRTTVNLLENSTAKAKIYTLDILEDLPDNKFAGHPRAKQVERIVCDTLKLDTKPYAKKMDFIFIDANHEYEFVLSDSYKALEMLKPGGVIVWHDYTFVVDTKRALNTFIEAHPQMEFQHIENTTMVIYQSKSGK